ncbi:sialic acid-binding Ig-like lectin 5 isoform X4 [Saccopteryx bilineata]|uniref:sialic acid-binding Ig-like lectin 5 isoform X4 n=1 Tax=Saccopteryx bilineata TaxID=59482 RepID=UPI00338D83D2
MVPLLLLPLLWGGSLQEQPDYELRVQESVRVQEGLCVHVPCYFSYPRSWFSSGTLYTYWYRDGDNTGHKILVATNNGVKSVTTEFRNRFLLADPKTNDCSLSIRDARMRDTGTYFFRVEKENCGNYSYKEKKLKLQVTALTDKPDIHIPELLEADRSTQLTCSLPGACEGGGPLTFSWVGGALDSLNPQTLHSSVLIFTPKPQDHGTNLTCQVKCAGSSVITQRTVWLNVFYAPRHLIIGISFRNVTALKILQTISSLTILEGEAVRLLCVADSNPPAELSWFRGSPALNATPISSTATLELLHVGTEEEGEFSCRARHPLGSQTLSLSLSVVRLCTCSPLTPPELPGHSCSWEDQGLHCSCSSRAQPAPSLRWRLGAGLLEGNHSNASCRVTSRSAGPWANSSLSLSRELSAGLRLSCEASNVHGTQSAAVLLLTRKSVSQAGVVPAALGGAGVMALLSLCLCLLFLYIVRARRKPAAERPRVRDGEDPVVGTATWSCKQKSSTERLPDQASSAEDAPPSEEQQELQYANVNFHRMKPQEPQDQGATSSPEYSEIKKTRK